MTPDPQIAQSLTQIAATVSQMAAQLQQIGLQLSSLAQQVAQNQAAVNQIAPAAPQAELLKRFSSLEDLVQKLSIRVSAIERREVALTAPLRPVELEVELEEDEIEDEPDEILWDFIEPVVPSSELRST